MSGYTHLHLHTQYSILDGASNIKKLMQKAKECNMTSVAITDHGNMYGVKEFHNAAKEAEIKPIIGCETYVAYESRLEKHQKDKENRGGYHLVLLAKNKTGYQNLIKLISLSWIDGYYYKPRIDKEILEKYKEGLIVSTACIGGEIAQAVINGQEKKGEELIQYFKHLFGDDFYLEIQRHPTGNPDFDKDILENQEKVIKKFKEWSETYQVKLIATNDVHFINKEDASAHDILICLNTNKEVEDQDRMMYTGQEYFKTAEEMKELFPDVPQVVDNTLEIADKVEEYELDSDPIMPFFPLPDEFEDENHYLQHLTYEGAQDRYGKITEDIKERLDFELSVVKKMGFPGYFLIVRDFLQAARERGVSVGPGRGSAAGSVVAYCNYITDIDPIKYNLLFERFLNPDRISMPDIDIDFDEDGREKVLDYVVNKYGENRVAHIITFGTMAARMAIRDVGRVLKLSLPETDKLAKLVPEKPGTTLKQAYKEINELKTAKNSDNPLVSKTLKFAETLEGSVRQTGLHACGVIIGKNDLVEHIPLCTVKDTNLLVTQYDGSHIEDVGMLKMDFLGLKTLSIIKDAVVNIKESKGDEVDIDHIPLDDQPTFELYSKGETTGLFQFESDGMKRYLKELKPNRFEDLIAMNALYRPGPMDYIPSFIKRKYGKEEIKYDLPVMEDYLKETYGITVYQEQVMLLSQAMAGFTGGQADSLRKAMGKKKKKLMAQLKEKFVQGCKENGYDEKIINKVWEDWEAFAQYAFNKSHSTCYAYISYQTGYLKAHYPSEFMAAVLSRNINDIKKITVFMDECRRMGISVLGPDVNESNYKFTVNKDGNIRFGIGAIKGVGENAVKKIIEERTQNGHYKDIFDFIERVSLQTVNKKSIEALAYAGAFDGFEGIDRHHFFVEDTKGITFLENLIKYGNKFQNDKNVSQQSLFGGEDYSTIAKPPVMDGTEWDNIMRLNKEKEVVGIYLSAHPLDDYKFEVNSFCNTNLAALSNDLGALKGKELTFAAIVTGTKEATTKNGKPYGIITIEDYTDTYRIALFSEDYIQFKNYFMKGYMLLVKAKVQERKWGRDKGEPELVIKHIDLLAEAKEKLVKNVSLSVPLNRLSGHFINEIKQFTDQQKGNAFLNFIVYDTEENISITGKSRNCKIQISQNFIRYLDANPEIVCKVNGIH